VGRRYAAAGAGRAGRPPRRPEQLAVPAETTIRRTLARLDADALAGTIGAWLADRQRRDRGDGAGPDQRQRPRQRAVAVDGKTLRGAHPPDGDSRPVHLLAGMDHTSRTVLAQRQVGGAPEEVPAFQPLLDGLDLVGVVVTADALHTHPDAAWVPGRRQAGPLPVVVKAKGAHPAGPLEASALAPRPRLDTTRDCGHGRIERRTLKAVTSLTHAQVRPARLVDLLRGHWAIEALHHVRDVTFAEDTSQVRTGAGPSVMACLRNLVIGLLGRAGPVNLAAELRRHARDPRRPLATLGISLG
jgi:predicted transposase YbfD/YdcC